MTRCETAPLRPDSELIAAMAAGDGRAVELLYDRHAPALLALAQRLMRDPGEAEDLVHDVFVEAWRGAAGYDPARASGRTWLIVRLRSRALDRLRSARYTRLDLLPPEQTPALSQPADQARAAERRRACDQLAGLPPEQRAVLELAYFSGLSAAEIAARLDLPAGTVKSRLGAALRRLREGGR